MRDLLMLNPIISVGFISWIAAQILKTLYHSIKSKKFDPGRIAGAGGMPSSHSSMVVSVVVYTLRVKNVADTEFAFAVLLAAIVIYDAMSVRYNAGLHAKEINRLRSIIGELGDKLSELEGDEKMPAIDELTKQRKLNESLGHKPIEVLAGSLLGTLIAMIFPIKQL